VVKDKGIIFLGFWVRSQVVNFLVWYFVLHFFFRFFFYSIFPPFTHAPFSIPSVVFICLWPAELWSLWQKAIHWNFWLDPSLFFYCWRCCVWCATRSALPCVSPRHVDIRAPQPAPHSLLYSAGLLDGKNLAIEVHVSTWTKMQEMMHGHTAVALLL
jgi:hypothetical protein